jgi:hypothetical protein
VIGEQMDLASRDRRSLGSSVVMTLGAGAIAAFTRTRSRYTGRRDPSNEHPGSGTATVGCSSDVITITAAWLPRSGRMTAGSADTRQAASIMDDMADLDVIDGVHTARASAA